MNVNIYKLKEQMEDILLQHGVELNSAKIVANDYWEAEMSGKKTHGISKFIKELAYLHEREGNPEIIIDKGSIMLVDGHKEFGQIAANYCVDLLIERTKRNGIAMVGLKNIQRYGALQSWVKKIAENDLIGIITNTCEPAAAPFGASSKVLGSNPIAVGIPTLTEPILLDMATSQVAMSTIWTSLIEKRNLPESTFFDKNGKHTVDPSQAQAVEIFGGYKGYGLSLIIEILSGSLITANMGAKITSPYDIGYYFQAIDPSVFQDIKTFKTQNDSLVKEIKSSKKKTGVDEILIPGERSRRKMMQNLKLETIDISQKACEILFQDKN